MSLWKGAAKPLALGVVVFAGLAGILHHVAVPPTEPSEDVANEAQRQALARREAAGVTSAEKGV